jgi:hypothetical protein
MVGDGHGEDRQGSSVGLYEKGLYPLAEKTVAPAVRRQCHGTTIVWTAQAFENAREFLGAGDE